MCRSKYIFCANIGGHVSVEKQLIYMPKKGSGSLDPEPLDYRPNCMYHYIFIVHLQSQKSSWTYSCYRDECVSHRELLNQESVQ